jgi:transcriptional regulator with XRE-family HTH domain
VTLLYALLGRQIAHYRKQARLTQEALAEATNYSVDFISLVERGVNAPTLARLKNIAKTQPHQTELRYWIRQSGKIAPLRDWSTLSSATSGGPNFSDPAHIP